MHMDTEISFYSYCLELIELLESLTWCASWKILEESLQILLLPYPLSFLGLQINRQDLSLTHLFHLFSTLFLSLLQFRWLLLTCPSPHLSPVQGSASQLLLQMWSHTSRKAVVRDGLISGLPSGLWSSSNCYIGHSLSFVKMFSST